jgi:hypothetical protein
MCSSAGFFGWLLTRNIHISVSESCDQPIHVISQQALILECLDYIWTISCQVSDLRTCLVDGVRHDICTHAHAQTYARTHAHTQTYAQHTHKHTHTERRVPQGMTRMTQHSKPMCVRAAQHAHISRHAHWHIMTSTLGDGAWEWSNKQLCRTFGTRRQFLLWPAIHMGVISVRSM